MADNFKLTAEYDADVSGLVGGIKEAKSAVSNVEKEIIDAFGGMDGVIDGLGDTVKSVGDVLDSSFAKGVSTISDAEGEVADLKGKVEELSDVDGFDDMFAEMADSANDAMDEVDVLYDTLNMLDRLDVGDYEFREMADEVSLAGIEVDDLTKALRSMGDVKIDDDMLEDIAQSARDAEGDVDKFASSLKGINGSDVKGVGKDFDSVGGAAKGAENDVDKFDSSVKGAGDGSSLPEIEADLDDIADKASEASDMLAGMAGVLGGLVGIGGIADAFDIAMETAQMNTSVELAIDVAYGFDRRGDLSLDDTNIRREFDRLANKIGEDEALSLIQTVAVEYDFDEDPTLVMEDILQLDADNAITLSMKYDVDASELIYEATNLAGIMEITSSEAMAMQDYLLQAGLPAGELDIVREYGQQLKRAGFSVEEITSIFESGLDTGTWNIDILMDGLKEGRILLAEFGLGVDDATAELLEGTGISAKQMEEWGKAVAKGGDEGAVAMLEAAKALNEVEDATLQNELGVKMFGTMWEEEGTNIVDTLMNVDGSTIDLQGSLADLTEQTELVNDEPWLRIGETMGKVKTKVGELLEPVLEIVATFLEWATANEGVLTVIIALVGALTAVSTIIALVAGGIAVYNAVMGIATIVSTAMGIASLAAFGWIVLAIVAVIAVVLLVIYYWEEIWAVAKKVGSWISDMVGVVVGKLKKDWEEGAENFKKVWEKVSEFFSETWEKVSEFFGKSWERLKEVVGTAISAILTFILMPFVILRDIATVVLEYMQGLWEEHGGFIRDIWAGIMEFFEGIGAWFSELWDGIIGFFIEKWETGIENLKMLWEGIKEFFAGIGEWFGELWTGIVEFFTTLWTTVTEWFEQVWEGVKVALTPLTEFFSSLWSGIVEFFRQVWDAVIEWFVGIWEKVKEPLNRVKTFMTDIWETIKNTVQDKVRSLVDKAVELFTSLYDKVKEKVDNIKTAVGDAIQGAYDKVTGWFGKFKDAGANIIGNIIDGIKGMAGRLKETASSTFQTIRDMLPFSPPKDKSSPLAGIEDNGIIEQIIKGIKGQERELDNAMHGLLSGYDTTASIGMDATVLEDEFSRIGYGLEASVNGNINHSVGVSQEVGITVERQDLYATFVIEGSEFRGLVENITDEQEQIIRMRR